MSPFSASNQVSKGFLMFFSKKYVFTLLCLTLAAIMPSGAFGATRSAYCAATHRNTFNNPGDPLYYSDVFAVEMSEFTARDGPHSIDGLSHAFAAFINSKYQENTLPYANFTECHTLHDPDDENSDPNTQFADILNRHPGIRTGWRPGQ